MVDWTKIDSEPLASTPLVDSNVPGFGVPERLRAMAKIEPAPSQMQAEGANESALSKLSREADLLLHGVTRGTLDAGYKKITEHPVQTSIEVAAGVAIGGGLALAQGKAGWVRLGAEIVGLAMTGVAIKDTINGGHLQRTGQIMSDAWNDPSNQNYYRNKAAAEIGPLAFDTTLMVGAGALGARGSRALFSEKAPLLRPTEPVPDVYKKAELYDVAFSYRDIAKENNVMTGWYREMTGKAKPESVIELAAGPARHAREFAGRGIEASMLDYSPEMVNFARAAAIKDGKPLAGYIKGDMTDFTLPKKTDMAVTMLDSVGHLHTDAAMVQHLQAVGRNLKPGGVYVMEMNNPHAKAATTQNIWSITEGNTTVNMQWGKPGDSFNPVTGLRTHSVELQAKTPAGPATFTDRVTMREWDQPSIDRAIAQSGMFTRVQKFGDFAPDATFNSSESWRMIYVMSRKP
jgi:ubiquinone/menaquinone biosynthesis C-methylase UbiE